MCLARETRRYNVETTADGLTAKAERDIAHRGFHNQPVSTLTQLAVNAPQGDVAGRYAQIRDTARVHERALFAVPRIPSELELQARWFAGDFGRARSEERRVGKEC